MYASAGGHLPVVTLLIDSGADVNKLHAHGGSALMEASTSGNFTVVQLLIEKGADATLKDKDGVTALMSAASQGHTKVCELLLEKGVDVNAMAASGGTALMFSAAGGFKDVTELLISKGADVNAKVKATKEYKNQVAEGLKAGTEGVEEHKDDVTALMVAALGGWIDVTKLLLEHGADVKAKDEEGTTALKSAVQGNHGEVAAILVEAGANPNDVYKDEDGVEHNLLMDSIIVENEKFAKLLIQHGADVLYKDKHGVTTLIQAAYKGLTDVVKLLVESKKIKVDAASEEQITALIAAAGEGHQEIGAYLHICVIVILPFFVGELYFVVVASCSAGGA